jgi:predicted nucleotide-binding protein (sugar kinase/HSP70/actin superfamily)
MSDKNIDRKQIMTTFLLAISRLADEDYQKRIWIQELGPECEDYADFINYFLYEGREILKDPLNFNLKSNQLAKLKQLQKEVEEFNKKNSTCPEKFTSCFDWKKIINTAKEFLKSFNSH